MLKLLNVAFMLMDYKVSPNAQKNDFNNLS